MRWFERLTGFSESTGDDIRSKLQVDGELLRSSVNGWTGRIGTLTTPTLEDLRQTGRRLLDGENVSHETTTVREVVADATALHANPTNAGAVFQVASQFNLLEMMSPEVTPEAGVTGYDRDRTQGPACAIACGAGTIYRNWLVPVAGGYGQTSRNQINCLAKVGAQLGNTATGPALLWTMRNGYALATGDGLDRITTTIAEPAVWDEVAARLCVGVQANTEVTVPATTSFGNDDADRSGHTVTQIYGSALPVAYSRVASPRWEPFARLILQASYEATLWAAIANRMATGNNTVYLTLLGGGVFGNETPWIVDAIERAVAIHSNHGLDVAVVSYRRTNPALAPLLTS